MQKQSTKTCEPPNTRLHHVVTVDAAFGSDIQRDVALRTLSRMLMVWKETVEGSHKDNKVTLSEGQ
jgi:hypothetical protein